MYFLVHFSGAKDKVLVRLAGNLTTLYHTHMASENGSIPPLLPVGVETSREPVAAAALPAEVPGVAFIKPE